MGEVNDVTGLRWHIYYQDSEPQCTDLTYSEDGNVWYSLSAGVPFTPVLSENWKWFKFKRTVKARYIRFTALSEQRGQDFASGAELVILAD